jgi:hypothetical protein
MSEVPAIGASGLPGKRVEAQRAGITITAFMSGDSSGDSSMRITRSDRELMRRLTVVVLFLLLATASFWLLHRMYSRKFFDLTGTAQWIWAPMWLQRDHPVVFHAVRDFDLPERRYYTRIKIHGDPEYTLYFNGQRVAHRRTTARNLDVFDVTKVARTGLNRIVVAVRSPGGARGLIAGVDLGPEIENYVVTGPEWKIFWRWTDSLPLRDSTEKPTAPMIIGHPPIGRWNFLALRNVEPAPEPSQVVAPREVFSFRATLPEIKPRSGVPVVVPKAVRATAYDFGPVTGQVRLTATAFQPEATLVRLTNTRNEIFSIEGYQRPFVFGSGERTVVDAEVHSFRYVVVYGGRARADVLR